MNCDYNMLIQPTIHDSHTCKYTIHTHAYMHTTLHTILAFINLDKVRNFLLKCPVYMHTQLCGTIGEATGILVKGATLLYSCAYRIV